MDFYITQVKTLELFLCIERIFRQNRSVVLNNRNKFMEIIEATIIEFEFANCHNIKSKLLSRFIEFRCKNLGRYLNKQIMKKK